MRELLIGEEIVRVRATPLTLLFYKQEFNADLIGDLVKMDGADKDHSKLNMLDLLQMVWAMAKTDSLGKPFPSFEKWLSELDVDLSNPDFVAAAMEEAADGFFRGKSSPAAGKNKRGK